MAGTKIGGQKAAASNKKKYGEDFYARIGKVGGSHSSGGGFAYWKRIGREDLIRAAGIKGGQISRRQKATTRVIDVVLMD